MTDNRWSGPASLAQRLVGELSDFRRPAAADDSPVATDVGSRFDLDSEFDRRVLDPDLCSATRSRFVTKHYSDAVESGVKALCECIRSRTGRTEDGDPLVTTAFSPNDPLLRINRGRSKSDESEQRGHMFLCQGVVAAWRNPRAHALIDDSPARALMMLEVLNDLIATTKAATRTRKRRAQ
ncbi:TIGR02391 family protein [Candidatus Poriferisodalis sp.]|uniref:TIGR02391 family protein n=1 Tax=Candidatus Poriferisodalis sp. TaxID=3101277 RepID=UPI003C702DD7